MSEELERLRADLEVLRKFTEDGIEWDLAELIDVIETRVRKLEAEADPWREAREIADRWKDNPPVSKCKLLCEYVDHLTTEIGRLEKRVAELEAEIKAEDEEDIADAERALADMQPPFEGEIVGIEPVLDPARVLATAADMAYRKADFEFAKLCCLQMKAREWKTVKPYRVKGSGDE